MLGDTLKDPFGVEAGGEIRGMGLLPMDTEFSREKTRTRVTGRFEGLSGTLTALSEVEIEGYEIHMGETILKEEGRHAALIQNYAEDSRRMEPEAARAVSEHEKDGLQNAGQPPHGHARTEVKRDGAAAGNVYGTYVHGVFDREGVVKTIVMALGEKKGIDMSQVASVDFAAFKEIQYDKLAEGLRQNLDMKKIYEIMEKGLD